MNYLDLVFTFKTVALTTRRCSALLSYKLVYLIIAAMGVVPSPFDCYMVNRSLKTLALRMEQHKKSSWLVAKWLENHPNVVEVLHPGNYYIFYIYFKSNLDCISSDN